MFMAQVSLEYYTLMLQIQFLLATVMQIGQDAQMIGKALQEDVSFLGHCFKSTPSQRSYWLPSEKNQVTLSDSSSVSLHDENVASVLVDNVEYELVVSESRMSKIDLDERDDVPLARLLKKGLFSKVGSIVVDALVPLVHSDSSSSSYNVIVLTLVQQSIPNLDLVSQPTDNVGENINENVDSYPLPRFFSSLVVHLNVDILTVSDAPGSSSWNLRVFDTDDINENAKGFIVHRDLASKIINTLTAESRALSTSINFLFNRRLEVDSLVRHLKTLIPSSSTAVSASE
ncbi:envelope-like protein [Cucumis melo var. makuwa]|uniref:Envelope-like protein n=1 Tax=Cucumis melo var. makuwa TaxID=1194695 RepID=A0A5D3BPV5_CUCMM|nr:envelope-like protein [Cucumis melo var. makuwa]